MLEGMMFLRILEPTKFILEHDPVKGGIYSFWYNNWLVLGGFIFSLLLTGIIVRRSKLKLRNLLLIGVMVSALMASLPLTILRLGFDSAILKTDAVGYISMAGTFTALVVALTFLMRQSSESRKASANDHAESAIFSLKN